MGGPSTYPSYARLGLAYAEKARATGRMSCYLDAALQLERSLYDELVETLALAEAGKIHITATHYPLDQAMQAYRDLAAGSVDGRAVITPGR